MSDGHKHDAAEKGTDGGDVKIDRVEGDVNVTTDDEPKTDTEAQREGEQDSADEIADDLRK